LKNFEALLPHLKFVGEHQQRVGRVAAVTDSEFLTIMPRIVAHFVSAEVQHSSLTRTNAWLETGASKLAHSR
jgi:hypothetical protein